MYHFINAHLPLLKINLSFINSILNGIHKCGIIRRTFIKWLCPTCHLARFFFGEIPISTYSPFCTCMCFFVFVYIMFTFQRAYFARWYYAHFVCTKNFFTIFPLYRNLKFFHEKQFCLLTSENKHILSSISFVQSCFV